VRIGQGMGSRRLPVFDCLISKMTRSYPLAGILEGARARDGKQHRGGKGGATRGDRGCKIENKRERERERDGEEARERSTLRDSGGC